MVSREEKETHACVETRMPLSHAFVDTHVPLNLRLLAGDLKSLVETHVHT